MTSNEKPSRPTYKASTSRECNRSKKERASAPYTLRPRTNLRSPTPIYGQFALNNYKKGRLEDWQTEVLEGVLKAGIWHPGDATVALLVEELGDR